MPERRIVAIRQLAYMDNIFDIPYPAVLCRQYKSALEN